MTALTAAIMDIIPVYQRAKRQCQILQDLCFVAGCSMPVGQILSFGRKRVPNLTPKGVMDGGGSAHATSVAWWWTIEILIPNSLSTDADRH